jgi:hypothetical protein
MEYRRIGLATVEPGVLQVEGLRQTAQRAR